VNNYTVFDGPENYDHPNDDDDSYDKNMFYLLPTRPTCLSISQLHCYSST
jgi:hypothetical protein